MRWLLVVLVLAAGCSADEPAVTTDSGAKTCATTACIAGATCATRSGATCRCVADGVWTCGDDAPPPAEGGIAFDSEFVFDAASEDTAVADTMPMPGLTRSVTSCRATANLCDGEDPVGSAEAALASLMRSCGANCTQLTLTVALETGCPLRIEANVEWTATALDCVAAEVANYLWTCAPKFNASTMGSCPD